MKEATALKEIMDGQGSRMPDAEKTGKAGIMCSEVRKPSNIATIMVHSLMEGIVLSIEVMIRRALIEIRFLTVGSQVPRTWRLLTCSSTFWSE